MRTIQAVLMVLAACGLQSKPSSAQETLTIGMENQFGTRVNERDGQMTVCASVMGTQPQSYAANVSILYQNRSAMGGKDFVETPYQFLFTPQAQRHCFSVTLIDDTIFEATQEFFVNLTTTDENILLSPNFIVITVNDNDIATISWEHATQTVGEADGVAQVCGVLTGKLETNLPAISVKALSGTAIEDHDFTISNAANLLFPRGSVTGDRRCIDVALIKQREYEGDENFTLELMTQNSISYDRVELGRARTQVVITDYSVITEQQPSSICEGLSNLINVSSTQEMCRVEKNNRTEECDALTCNATSDWILDMSFNSCPGEVTLNLTDLGTNESFSETFSSSDHVQEYNFTLMNVTGSVRLTSRVVPDQGRFYFLVEAESTLLNLSFPVTPVPVECSQEGQASTHSLPKSTNASTTEDNVNSGGLSKTVFIIIGGAAGGGGLVILVIVVTIIVVAICGTVYFKKRRKKETITSYW